MSNAQQLLTEYLQAFGARDFERMRCCLADRGFAARSPIGSFDDADRYIDSLFGVGPIIEQLRIRKLLAEDDQALALVDITVTLDNYATHTSALWCRTAQGRIVEIESVFDASDYKAMFSEQFQR